MKKALLYLKEQFTILALLVLFHLKAYSWVGTKFRIADVDLLRKHHAKAYADLTDHLWAKEKEAIGDEEVTNVAFVIAHIAMWSCDVLYHLFASDPKFNPYIVLAYSTRRNNGADTDAFEKSKEWLVKQNLKFRTLDLDTPKKQCFEKMGKPKIVFYLTPYSNLLPEGCNLVYLPASVLTIYIPYSFMLSDAPNKFTCPGMVNTWRHFSDSAFYRKMLISHDPLNERNTYFVGYPKMDIYYEPSETDKKSIWKVHPGADERKVKCIIYAPHHSLEGSEICTQHFSTFKENYLAFLEYAAANSLTTSWIFKPHPALRTTAVATGLFASEKEYDGYLKKWDALPNAQVVEEATYYDIFKTSDAMILDSVSFIAEYQFTQKPLLFLTKENQNFNEFGRALMDRQYCAKGDDWQAIRAFIEDVVVNGKDENKGSRTMFFRENLDYRSGGESSASRQIYDHILHEIKGNSN